MQDELLLVQALQDELQIGPSFSFVKQYISTLGTFIGLVPLEVLYEVTREITPKALLLQTTDVEVINQTVVELQPLVLCDFDITDVMT